MSNELKRSVEIIQWGGAGQRRKANRVERRQFTNEELREFVGKAYQQRIETYVEDRTTGEEIAAVTRDTFGGRKKAVWLWWSE